MNSLTEALHDFEFASKFDPSNKDISRELLSVVDNLALNLNGKRVAYPFDPLTSSKKGKKPVQSYSEADSGVPPCEAGIVSSLAESALAPKMPSAGDVIGTSSEVMEFLHEPFLPVEIGGCSDHTPSTTNTSAPNKALFESMNENYPSSAPEADGNNGAPSSASTSVHTKFVFTNKKQAHRRLHLSAHAYNKLLLGENIEFFHPRSGAVLRVRPLTPKTIQPGTLHGDMSWEAAVPTSDPLPGTSLSKEVTCHLQTHSGFTDEALVQEECFVRTDKKKRLSSGTSYASKVSTIQFQFESVRTHSQEHVCRKGHHSAARGLVARATTNLKKRVSVTRLSSSFCRYIKTSIAVRKTKRRDDYPIQFDDYYPPFKKSRLGVSIWSKSEFSSFNWMSSCLEVFGTRPFENG